MAERRMFAKSIVLSDAFLDMPLSARCLYFTLGMLADDEGFVGSPKAIMRQCGATQDDMLILLKKRYVLGFDSGVIVIKHWKLNNYLQNDRIKQTTYLEEKETLGLDGKGAYTEKSRCIQDVSKVYTQSRVDKNSIDKNSIEREGSAHRFGKYSNVVLTQEEYAEWLKECPKAEIYIDRLSEYMQTSGKSYRSHIATMRKWWNDDKKKETPRSYDLDAHTERAMTETLKYKKV